MFRKTLFWCHLIAGVTSGLVVVMMSVTGVILTYERQMVAWSDRDYYQEPQSGAVRHSLDALVSGATQAGLEPASITVFANPSAPVSLSAARGGGTFYLSPYSGEYLGQPETWLRDFFDDVTGWHRWFNAEGDARALPRAITGISNLAFLFLIVSGAYLWLPKVFRWPLFRARLRFENRTRTSRERDFNWHHVFGIWIAVPLFVVVATATVFSYPWANALVYRSVGEPVPAGMGMGMGVALAAPIDPGYRIVLASADLKTPKAQSSLENLFLKAANQIDDWQSIAMVIPGPQSSTVRFTIDQGDGGQPQKRHSLELDRATGQVESWQPFTTLSTGVKARQWIRRLHTGESFGLTGQTIAGVVSLLSILMAWTGLALAYRRLIQPLMRKTPS